MNGERAAGDCPATTLLADAASSTREI